MARVCTVDDEDGQGAWGDGAGDLGEAVVPSALGNREGHDEACAGSPAGGRVRAQDGRPTDSWCRVAHAGGVRALLETRASVSCSRMRLSSGNETLSGLPLGVLGTRGGRAPLASLLRSPLRLWAGLRMARAHRKAPAIFRRQVLAESSARGNSTAKSPCDRGLKVRRRQRPTTSHVGGRGRSERGHELRPPGLGSKPSGSLLLSPGSRAGRALSHRAAGGPSPGALRSIEP